MMAVFHFEGCQNEDKARSAYPPSPVMASLKAKNGQNEFESTRELKWQAKLASLNPQ